MRRWRMAGAIGGHFPDLAAKEPKPKGLGAKVPDRTARPTKPFHLANQAQTEYAARLGGNWIYAD